MPDPSPYDRPVQLWKMTRRQFREGIYDGSLKGAIIPTGSTEQHNEHLEMFHDTVSAVHIAEQVAQKLYPGVVVTTPIAIGVSGHWMDHKGTLTTRPETRRNQPRAGGQRPRRQCHAHAGLSGRSPIPPGH